jgi:hypothetical protein
MIYMSNTEQGENGRGGAAFTGKARSKKEPRNFLRFRSYLASPGKQNE